MHQNIFAPGRLAVKLADGLAKQGNQVTLFAAGRVRTAANLETVDMRGVNMALNRKKLTVRNLIKNDLETFKRLFKVIEFEILVNALRQSNKYDIVHVYITSGPEGPLLSKLCKKPILFTLHDPYNLNFPNKETYSLIKNVCFTTISESQRKKTQGLKVLSTIYPGIDIQNFKLCTSVSPDSYLLYFGRIIKSKGVHIAIELCKKNNWRLKIAGLHYEGHGGDHYWSKKIHPHIDNKLISYEGFITNQRQKVKLLGGAKALLFPIIWEEPFGLAIVEANACGTPVVAFNRGSVPELIENGVNGYIAKSRRGFERAIRQIDQVDRATCRSYVEKRFSLKKMIKSHEELYRSIISSHARS